MFKIIRRPSPSSAANNDDSIARIAIAKNGVIAYASPAFCALTGHESQSCAGRRASELIKFFDGSSSLETLSPGAHKIRIAGQAGAVDFHFDWLTTSDKKRYLIGSAVREKDPRKVFEQKIIRSHVSPIESAEDLSRLLALAQEILIVANERGEILRVNEMFCSVLGYDHAEISGLTLSDLIRPDGRARTKAGGNRWLEIRESREKGLIYYAARDVTSLKKEQRALARREEQLREAESIGRMGRWRWAIGQEDVEWSDEVFRIFGLSKEDFTPSFDRMRAFIHKSDIDRVNHALQRAMIERNDYDMEFRIERPDGAARYIRCEGRCAVNDDGEAVALFGIMQDVTELMKHEQELRAAKESAERAYAAKSQFLANMSHELRTPLNAILGFSEIMMRQLLGPVGTEKYLEYIKGIHQSGEHLLNIINDILVMSKIEAGKYELALEEVNVLKIVKLAAHMMEGKAMDSEINIAIAPAKNESRFIIADRRAILQALLNLISNAVKFSPRGGAVRIECSEGERFMSIKVIDNGVGIPANKLASITKPFEQVQSHYARDHEGTGLGLAITKDLVEMHGGSLIIESQVGKGTAVTLRLPYDGSKTAV